MDRIKVKSDGREPENLRPLNCERCGRETLHIHAGQRFEAGELTVIDRQNAYEDKVYDSFACENCGKSQSKEQTIHARR